MLSLRDCFRALGTIAIIYAAVLLAFAQQKADSGKPASVPGQSEFISNCASCHGVDGRGGEKAPNIATDQSAQELSDAQLSDILGNGVPETGMPAFRNLGADEIATVIRYLRILQGSRGPRNFPGDPTRGRKLFFGSAECSMCHTISGEGGFLGPDLSSYGYSLSADEVRNNIIRTTRTPASRFRVVSITTRSGDRFDAILRNEDNFSLQLQTRDGELHLLDKADVQIVERSSQSLMPTNYAERLNAAELNDLASFLMSVTPAILPPEQKKESFEDQY